VIRRLSTFIFVISIIAWLATMAVYVRSKFRADVITVIGPGRNCLVIASVNRRIEFYGIRPWPGPRHFQWSSAIACFDLPWRGWTGTLIGPSMWSLDADRRRIAAAGFSIAGGATRYLSLNPGYEDLEEIISHRHDPPPIDLLWKVGYLGHSGYRSLDVKYLRVENAGLGVADYFRDFSNALARHRRPPPVAAGIAASPRALHPMCYDSRQTPVRCPECGWRRVVVDPI
jgi:hypothetical protein